MFHAEPIGRASPRHWGRLVLLPGLLIAACTTTPTLVRKPDPAAETRRIAFYPAAGQGAAQQQRDRYDCFLEAASAARFDPSVPSLPAAHRISIVLSHQPIAVTARTDEIDTAPAGGLPLDERAKRYRLLVVHCLTKRGYGVR